MQPIYLSELLPIGSRSRYLLDAQERWLIHGKGNIFPHIDGFLEDLKTLNFTVTVAASRNLAEFGNELRKTESGARLSKEQAARLSKIMDKLRSTLTAEASTQVAYILTDKRYDVRKLVESPHVFFAKGTFGKLPPL